MIHLQSGYREYKMTIEELTRIIDGKVICCEDQSSPIIEYAFASDLMSDVLTVETDNMLLITGLANLQAIRTAEMSDISCIVFARAKKITDEMISIAKENKMTLIESHHSLFHISGELYKAGVKSIY